MKLQINSNFLGENLALYIKNLKTDPAKPLLEIFPTDKTTDVYKDVATKFQLQRKTGM